LEALMQRLLDGEESSGQKIPALLRGSRAMSILEFGRTVHAEMAALMDAARRGVSVNGSILYTTTFPCHLCARHIVAAGISRVVYVEPYPKSLARDLYPDSIDVDGERRSHSDAITFEPFTGVAPRKYFWAFEPEKRKFSSGKTIDWKKRKAEPKAEAWSRSSHLHKEKIVVDMLKEIVATTSLWR